MLIKGFKNILFESKASEEAERLNLTHYGRGRYGKNGVITHQSSDEGQQLKKLDKPVKTDDKPEDKPTTDKKPPQKEPTKREAGKLSDKDDPLSDGDIKQKGLDIGFRETEDFKPAPGNAGSMMAEIMSGEVSSFLQDNPDMSQEEIQRAIYDQVADTTLGKQNSGSKVGTARTKTPEGLNQSLYTLCGSIAKSGIQKHKRIRKTLDSLVSAGKIEKPVRMRNFYGHEVSIKKQVELIEKSDGPFYTNKGIEVPKDVLVDLIKKSGGGENPSDTSTIAIDEKGRGVVTFHSDKISTADIQANSTPNKEAGLMKSFVDKSNLSIEDKRKAIDILSEGQKLLDEKEESLKDAGQGGAVEMSKKDMGDLLADIESNKGIEGKDKVSTHLDKSLMARGKVHPNIRKYLPDQVEPYKKEQLLKAFYTYMADDNKDKKPSASQIKLLNRSMKQQGLDAVDNLEKIRIESIEVQRNITNRLNEQSIDLPDGTKKGLGDFLEAKNVLEKLHIGVVDGEEGEGVGKYPGLFNLNMGGTIVEADQLKKALGITNSTDFITHFEVGKPGEGEEVIRNIKTKKITGRNVYVYAITKEGNKVPIAVKTQRSKQGETGRLSTTYQWTKEIQDKFKELNTQVEESFVFTEATKATTLAFFDIDETVFNTFAKVIVMDKDNKVVKKLDNQEFNTYKLKDGERYDFTQFGDAKLFKSTSKVIDSTMKRVKEEFKNKNTIVYFLTARADFDSNSMFKDTFRAQGLRVNDKRIRFELAGNLRKGTIPQKKEYIIRRQINRFNPTTIKIYDDHQENVDIANTIAPDFPNITFEKYLIKSGMILNKGKINEVTSFKSITEASTPSKNVHMTHIEDRVLYGGVKGAREAIFALRGLRDMLAGQSSKTTNVTVKWDGAPAVFAGIDPNDGQFFVAKKGIFNKNPKVYKSHADINADTSGDLSSTLKVAYVELKKLGIKDVIQGDLLFTDDVETDTINGEKYYTFQPNTIVYAVPVDSALGKRIAKSKIGIIFHTTYSGKDFETMKASYKVNINSLKRTPSVFFDDASLKDVSGAASLTKDQTKEVTEAISKAGKIFRGIASTTLKQIEKDPTLAQEIETFNNTFVRKGEEIGNPKSHAKNLITWFEDKYEKEIAKRSSEKGKDVQRQKRDERLRFFSKENVKNLEQVFELQKQIVVAKKLILSKLDNVKNMGTFIRTKNGFKVTGQEGYVAIDKIGGGVVKLVDRLEFSYNNFSPDTIKGWDR